MPLTINIKADFKEVDRNLIKLVNNLTPKESAGIGLLFNEMSKQMETYAKLNRPWTDRTTLARRSLKGRSFWDGGTVVAEISHNVYYGIYLEKREIFRGRSGWGTYAILMPTIQEFSKTMTQAVKIALAR